VVVQVRGVKSNARQLTEWPIVLTYGWAEVATIQEWKMLGQGLIRFRADVADYRLLPGETPNPNIVGGVPTKDSFLTVTASGVHSDGDCLVTLGGIGRYGSPADPSASNGILLSGGFNIDSGSRTGVWGFGFGNAPGSPHQVTISGGPRCTGQFPFAAFMGRLDGNRTVPVTQEDNPPTITISGADLGLDTNYGILARTFVDTGAGGSINVSWSPVPAKTPPRIGDDAGR
jgi:hypothetical protein